MKEDIFSKPNQVTYMRILLVPIFAIFMVEGRYYLATLMFIVLSLTDSLDGYIARRTNRITHLGEILDPIADKFLVITALVLLIDKIPLWMILIIVGREILITSMRFYYLAKKRVVKAEKLGKVKTVSQMVAIPAVILSLPYSIWIMFIAVVLTIVSGTDSLIKMRKSGGKNGY